MSPFAGKQFAMYRPATYTSFAGTFPLSFLLPSSCLPLSFLFRLSPVPPSFLSVVIKERSLVDRILGEADKDRRMEVHNMQRRNGGLRRTGIFGDYHHTHAYGLFILEYPSQMSHPWTRDRRHSTIRGRRPVADT